MDPLPRDEQRVRSGFFADLKVHRVSIEEVRALDINKDRKVQNGFGDREVRKKVRTFYFRDEERIIDTVVQVRTNFFRGEVPLSTFVREVQSEIFGVLKVQPVRFLI